MTLSVVMPTYGRCALLPEVVGPVLADAGADEIVVVVDGCDDGSYEYLRALDDPRLRPLLIENRGENGARAAGVEAATGEIVLLLDDDVRAWPGLAEGHARRHADSDGLVVLGWMPPDRAETFATRLYGREYEAICRGYERAPDAILDNLWAGNMSLRRSDCLRVMAGAPALDYHADRALGLRCADAGLRGVFDRSLRADHLHRRDLAGFIRDARNQGAAGMTLHRVHRDRLGPHPEEFGAGLPRPLREWLRLCRRPRAATATATALRAAAVSAGRMHAPGVEEAAGKLLRRVEQQRGALAA